MSRAPGWKVWGITVVTVLLLVVLTVLASVRLAENNTRDAIARAEQSKAQARMEQWQSTCQVVSYILTAYQETPPPTEAGRNVAQAWLDEYRILGCVPRR